MNLRVPLGAAIAFALVIAALTFSMTLTYSRNEYNERASNLREREAANSKFAEIDREIRQKYYGAIDETKLMDSVARGYINGIGDPNAVYISAAEYTRLKSNTMSDKIGIGAVLSQNPDGYLLVDEVYAESPAEVEGIKPGDLIVKMDDTDLTLENISAQAALIDDAPGTKVSLTVRREAEEFLVEIVRREIVIPTVTSDIIPDTNIGYIYISEFADKTSIQFTNELASLQNKGIESLIIDLRDNKGTVLNQAIKIVDRLVPAGLIVSAVYSDGTEVEKGLSDANQVDLPIVVITNENTAGPAELIAQVLKDYDMGVSVGVKTAGKANVQEDIQLSDGSVIRITTGKYLTKSGVELGDGVKPEYEAQMIQGFEGSWQNLDYNTDPQILKAIEVVQAISTEVQQ